MDGLESVKHGEENLAHRESLGEPVLHPCTNIWHYEFKDRQSSFWRFLMVVGWSLVLVPVSCSSAWQDKLLTSWWHKRDRKWSVPVMPSRS